MSRLSHKAYLTNRHYLYDKVASDVPFFAESEFEATSFELNVLNARCDATRQARCAFHCSLVTKRAQADCGKPTRPGRTFLHPGSGLSVESQNHDRYIVWSTSLQRCPDELSASFCRSIRVRDSGKILVADQSPQPVGAQD